MKSFLTLLLFVLGSLVLIANPIRDDEAVTLRGKVFDSMSRLPITSELKVIVFYDSDFIKDDSCRSTSGEFTISFANTGWYRILVSADGYLDSLDTLRILTFNRPPVERNYYLSPVHIPKKVIASNDNLFIEAPGAGTPIPSPRVSKVNGNLSLSLYFPFVKSSLTEISRTELDKVAKVLQGNTGAVLEINGYTDSNGPDDYNMMLSQWRVQFVVNYLVARGVNSLQLATHSYGEAGQSNRNGTIDDRAKNRRVDIVLLNTLLDMPRSNSQTSLN